MIHPLVTRDPWLETFLKITCYKFKEEEPHNFNFEIIKEYPKKPFFLTCKIPINISYQNVPELSLLKEVNIQNSYFLQDNVYSAMIWLYPEKRICRCMECISSTT